MEKRYLVKFDFGLDDAFGEELVVLNETELNLLKDNIGTEINIGEWSGKHSQVSGPLEYNDFIVISEDQEFIDKYNTIIGQFGLPVWYNFITALQEAGKLED